MRGGPWKVEGGLANVREGSERLPGRGGGLSTADGGGWAEDGGDDTSVRGGGVEGLDADLESGETEAHLEREWERRNNEMT